MEVQVVAPGQHEALDDVERVVLEDAGPGNIEPAAIDDEIRLALDRDLAALEQRR